MSADGHQTRFFRTSRRSLLRLFSAIGRRVLERSRSSLRVWADPVLPAILLGVVMAALAFAFILNAPPDVVFGVLGIGCLTAFLEAKQRN